LASCGIADDGGGDVFSRLGSGWVDGLLYTTCQARMEVMVLVIKNNRRRKRHSVVIGSLLCAFGAGGLSCSSCTVYLPVSHTFLYLQLTVVPCRSTIPSLACEQMSRALCNNFPLSELWYDPKDRVSLWESSRETFKETRTWYKHARYSFLICRRSTMLVASQRCSIPN